MVTDTCIHCTATSHWKKGRLSQFLLSDKVTGTTTLISLVVAYTSTFWRLFWKLEFKLTQSLSIIQLLHLRLLRYCLACCCTITDKIVETLSSNGVTSENKTIHTPPPPPPLHSKLGCLLFPTGSLNSSTTTYCMERVGTESFIFSFLSWQNIREAPFRANCLN